jgi:hypothetical protein
MKRTCLARERKWAELRPAPTNYRNVGTNAARTKAAHWATSEWTVNKTGAPVSP